MSAPPVERTARAEEMSEPIDDIGRDDVEEPRTGLLGVFRNRNFTLLWSSTMASQLGDHLNLMALTALIFAMSGGEIRGLEFSKILLLASAPVLIFGPVSGVYADRLNRKTLMIVSDLLRAALVALIPFLGSSMIPVYIIIFLVFTINRFYLSAKSAAIPQIVRSDQLMSANSLLNVAMVTTIVLGPAGGGILVERFGHDVGFFADAGTYVVSAVLAAFIALRSVSEIAAARAAERAERRRVLETTAKHALHAHSPAEFAEDAARIGREIAAPIEEEVEVIGSIYQRLIADLKDGARKMRENRIVMYSTISSAAVMFIAGFVLVATPVLVRNEFGVGTARLGVLFSAGGAGMLVGSLVVGRFFQAAERRAIVAVSFLLAGAGVLAISMAGSIPALAIWLFLSGLFIAPTMVTCDTILQESMPGESVGKAFGFRDMVAKAAFGVAGILSGVVADAVGPRYLLVAVGLGCLAYAGASPFLFADTTKLNMLNAYPLMRIVSGLAARLPRRMTYGLGSYLSYAAFLLLKEKRKAARENAARVLGASPESREAGRLARQMFRSTGFYWVDFFRLNRLTDEEIAETVRVECIEHIREALTHGRGAMIVTAHLGSWDVGGVAVAAEQGMPPLSAIVEPVTQESSNVAMTAMRERRGIRVIPLGNALGVGRALRRNEVVLIVGDRLIDGEGVAVEFFGEQTLLPRGTAYWSIKTGAPVLVGCCVRDADGGYAVLSDPPVYSEPTGDIDADVRLLTQRIATTMEKYIARYPEQWAMLQAIWPNGEGTGELRKDRRGTA